MSVDTRAFESVFRPHVDRDEPRTGANRRSNGKAGQGQAKAPSANNDKPISEGTVSDAFTAGHRHMLRFDHTDGRWYLWMGDHWRRRRSVWPSAGYIPRRANWPTRTAI